MVLIVQLFDRFANLVRRRILRKDESVEPWLSRRRRGNHPADLLRAVRLPIGVRGVV